jgi:hypothetical protein
MLNAPAAARFHSAHSAPDGASCGMGNGETYCEETSNVIRHPASDCSCFNAYWCNTQLAAQPFLGLRTQRWSGYRGGDSDHLAGDGPNLDRSPDHRLAQDDQAIFYLHTCTQAPKRRQSLRAVK